MPHGVHGGNRTCCPVQFRPHSSQYFNLESLATKIVSLRLPRCFHLKRVFMWFLGAILYLYWHSFLRSWRPRYCARLTKCTATAPPWQFGCKDCCAHANTLTYLLSFRAANSLWKSRRGGESSSESGRYADDWCVRSSVRRRRQLSTSAVARQYRLPLVCRQTWTGDYWNQHSTWKTGPDLLAAQW